MKFYNRDDELNILKRADKLKNNHAIMTMIIGRRRVGEGDFFIDMLFA